MEDNKEPQPTRFLVVLFSLLFGVFCLALLIGDAPQQPTPCTDYLMGGN